MKPSTSVFAALLVGTAAVASSVAHDEAIERQGMFARVDLHVEVDAFSGAAELVLALESTHPMSSIQFCDASGEPRIGFASAAGLRVGAQEMEFEVASASLPALCAQFPAGLYFVRGRTLRGADVLAPVTLDYRMPSRFAVVVPSSAAELPRDGAMIAWTSSEGASAYVLEIEDARESVSFEIRLPAEVTSFTVPAALLTVGEVYDYSLTAKGDSDNETELEGWFRVVQ